MRAAIFARLALLEARRGGLPWLVLLGIAAALALGAFLSQLAITEARMVQTAVVAAVLRAGAVFVVAAQVITSVLREINDKGLEMTLSLPLARSSQYFGRLAGFAACSLVLAIIFALPLALWAEPLALALWTFSLFCELAMVAAAALFFAMTLGQLVPALAATAGLYLLARSVSAMQAIAAGPLAEETFMQELARRAVDAVALLLPALDRATRTEWLLYEPPDWRSYALGVGALAVYAVLLAIAGAFDFERRSA